MLLEINDRVCRSFACQEQLTVSSAFAAAPAVVLSADAARRLKVHPLSLALTDVPDQQVPRGTVEREPPGIAQSDGPHLGGDSSVGVEAARIELARVIRRNGPRAGSEVIHVDAQDLAQI